MRNAEELERENRALRDRLSRLNQASLRINESLDFEAVLQGVLDSACSLTGARYGVIALVGASGRIEDSVTSGLTSEEHRRFMDFPEGMSFFEYLNGISEPLRLRDFHSCMRSLGLPEVRPPFPVSSPLPFLSAPIRHLGENVGAIYVGEKEVEFTPEDEETLVMFASQAALVIANARRHRDEQRARADLETLINTSPVGVAVFDARTGAPVSFNREATRIVDSLREPDQSPEQLLGVLTCRHADGREISLLELSMAELLSAGETVRAEEIVLRVPDGRSVTALLNATPIRSEDGGVESVVVTLQDLTPLEDLERLRAEFLGMVSHELRTPLATIKGSTTTLLSGSPDLDPHRNDPVPPDHEPAGRPHAGPDRRPSGRGPHLDGHALGQAGACGRGGAGGRCQAQVPGRRRPEQPAGGPVPGPAPGPGRPEAHRAGADQPALQRRRVLARRVAHPGERRSRWSPRRGFGLGRGPGSACGATAAPVFGSSRASTAGTRGAALPVRAWAWPSAGG